MTFTCESSKSKISRRASYLVVGILAFSLGLFAGKFYDSHQSSLPKADDAELRIDSEISRVLAQETGSLTHESWSLAMENLVTIGKTAVPKLLETIERARDLPSSDAGGAKPSAFFANSQTRIIQTRAVMILGQIGDARALPILHKLRAEDEQCPLRCEVDYAITNISMRQGR